MLICQTECCNIITYNIVVQHVCVHCSLAVSHRVVCLVSQRWPLMMCLRPTIKSTDEVTVY